MGIEEAPFVEKLVSRYKQKILEEAKKIVRDYTAEGNDFRNYAEIRDSVTDAIYEIAHKYASVIASVTEKMLADEGVNVEHGEVEEFAEKIASELEEHAVANVDLRAKLVEQVESAYPELRANGKIGYAIGVQHNTLPYRYYLEYIVIDEEGNLLNSDEDVKFFLEEVCGVKPYAWGINANYDSWGNFWFGVLDKEELESNEADLNLLTVLATQDAGLEATFNLKELEEELEEEQKDVFLEWCRKTFDHNAFYSVTEVVLEDVEKNWEEWKDTLVSWGIMPHQWVSPDKLKEILESLEPQKAYHIGEALANTEREILQSKSKPSPKKGGSSPHPKR